MRVVWGGMTKLTRFSNLKSLRAIQEGGTGNNRKGSRKTLSTFLSSPFCFRSLPDV